MLITLTWFFGALAWFVVGGVGVFVLSETHHDPISFSEYIAGLLLGPIALVLAIFIVLTEGLRK